MEELNFEIAWDDEARVWYTTRTPVPGVVAEASTIEELQRKLSLLIAEMSEIQTDHFTAPEPTPAPYIIKSIQLARINAA